MTGIPQRHHLSLLPLRLLWAALAALVPVRALAQTPAPIRAEYMAKCAGCHGAGGRTRGGGASHGADLPSHSLTDCSWMEMMSDATIFTAIKAGGPSIGMSAAMPPYGGRLSDGEIAEMVGYIRGLCAHPGSRSRRTPDLPLTAAEGTPQ